MIKLTVIKSNRNPKCSNLDTHPHKWEFTVQHENKRWSEGLIELYQEKEAELYLEGFHSGWEQSKKAEKYEMIFIDQTQKEEND